MEEYVIQDLRDRDARFSYDRTDVGTSLVVRTFHKEVGDVLMKWGRY